MDGDTYAIIPCTNQKSDTPGPAREVWIGSHFQLILAHAEMFYDKVLVMSYKYGLIAPDFVIEPYDIDMRTAKAADRIRWWFKMRGDIKEMCDTDPKPLLVALYTGDFERDRVTREFVKNGVNQILVPFKGLSVGQRQAAVYDCDPPYDPDIAQAGGYAIATEQSTGTAAPAGNKYAPPPSGLTDEIKWE